MVDSYNACSGDTSYPIVQMLRLYSYPFSSSPIIYILSPTVSPSFLFYPFSSAPSTSSSRFYRSSTPISLPCSLLPPPSPLFLPYPSHPLKPPFNPLYSLSPPVGRACSDSAYGRERSNEQSTCPSIRRPYSWHVHPHGAVCGCADFPHMGYAGLDAQVQYSSYR